MRPVEAGGVAGAWIVMLMKSSFLTRSRGRTQSGGAKCSAPHLPTRTVASAELAPSPGEHRSRQDGCRASQGRFPPPLWIRVYAIGKYAPHPNTHTLVQIGRASCREKGERSAIAL